MCVFALLEMRFYGILAHFMPENPPEHPIFDLMRAAYLQVLNQFCQFGKSD